MTILVATATRQGVLITQDSAMGPLPSRDAQKRAAGEAIVGRDPGSIQDHFSGNGVARTEGPLLGRMDKIVAFPMQRFVVGSVGSAAVVLMLASALRAHLPGNLDEAVAMAPGLLRQAMRSLPLVVTQIAIFGGWSDREGSFGLWTMMSTNDFAAPHRCLPGEGHCLTPNPWAGDQNYQALRSRWNAAAAADAPALLTKQFHRDCCSNLRQAFLRGQLGEHVTIAGPYSTWHIGRDSAALERWAPPGEPTRLRNPHMVYGLQIEIAGSEAGTGAAADRASHLLR